ncbi:MAG: hypothetical protein AAGB22_07995, partial [Bacteroidota bacterium]
MKQLGILLLLMCCCAPLCAQDIALATVPSGPDAPAQEEAQKHIKKGDEWLARGTEHFKEALPYFLKAQEIIPNDPELNFKIGKCYLLGSTERLRSLDYFLKARAHNPKVDPHLLYYLGQAYHLNMELDTALGTFKAYKKTIPPGTSFSKVQEVDRLMRQCE